MNFGIIGFLIGRLLGLISVVMLLPAAVAWYFKETDCLPFFLLPAAGVFLLAVSLNFFLRKFREDPLAMRDGFLMVTIAWLLLSFTGALPFYLSPYFKSFIDAFFEAASGFTTTGASILSDVEILPKSLLFWRSFSHWIGGMGIIVLAVAILPQLSVGGMQLMKSEMPGPTFEHLKPRMKQTALSLWKVYVLLSIIEVLILKVAGMSFFESFCHMFGSMGTGGFSTRNASVGAFSPAIQAIIAVFMFLAGMNFVLHYSMIKGKVSKLFQDREWRFYCSMIVLFWFVISLNLWVQGGFPFFRGVGLAGFQVLSIITTTGYATDAFEYWPQLSMGMLFLLMFVGGCAGSTSGGYKQIRLLLLFKRTKQSITEHIFSKAIVPVKLGGKVVAENVLHGVTGLFLLTIVLISFAVMAFLAHNLDFVTSTTAVVACLANVGPGLGDVGAAHNYGHLSADLKLLLTFLMIIGRLEIYTVLVLFLPVTWKK